MSIVDRYAVAESDRRQGNMLRMGTITEVDHSKALARVTLSDTETSAWLPWAVMRMGALRVWAPPVAGEQVMIAAPSGELNQAVILGSASRDQFPQPSNDPAETLFQWDDGSFIQHDAAKRQLRMHAPCGVYIIGTLIATDDVIAKGVSLNSHRHGGVRRGNAQTDVGAGGGSPPCKQNGSPEQ